MSAVRDFLNRSGLYLIATLGTLVSGLISFPIFTRILKDWEYGIMALTITIVDAGIAASKLGLQQSVIRLWTQHENQQGALVRTFALTQAAAGTAIALIVSLGALLLSSYLPSGLAYPLAIAAVLIPIKTLYSLTQSLLRTRDKPKTFVAIALINQFGGMFGAVFAVRVLGMGLRGFYAAFIIAESATLVLALAIAIRGAGARRAVFSKELLWEGLRFGLPLILFEVGALLLHSGDRFILEWFRDLSVLGGYAVAFNLARQLQNVIALPLDYAITPMVSRLYDKEGPAKAAEFLTKATRLFWIAMFPVIGGMVAVGEDLLLVMSGPKYRESAHLLPILLAGFLFFASRLLVAAGLFLTKRTSRLATLAVFGAIVNIALNFAMVPKWGPEGSAVAILISQVLLVIVLAWAGRSELAFDYGFDAMFKAILGSALMVLIVRALPLSVTDVSVASAALRLALKVFVGVAFYATWTIAVEGDLRRMVLGRLRKSD